MPARDRRAFFVFFGGFVLFCVSAHRARKARAAALAAQLRAGQTSAAPLLKANCMHAARAFACMHTTTPAAARRRRKCRRRRRQALCRTVLLEGDAELERLLGALQLGGKDRSRKRESALRTRAHSARPPKQSPSKNAPKNSPPPRRHTAPSWWTPRARAPRDAGGCAARRRRAPVLLERERETRGSECNCTALAQRHRDRSIFPPARTVRRGSARMADERRRRAMATSCCVDALCVQRAAGEKKVGSQARCGRILCSSNKLWSADSDKRPPERS